MTAIWQRDGSAWRALAPAGFADEKALHDLVAEAPHLLPLAGSPTLIVLGREVQVGPNAWADLLAVETTGRLAVVEIKLAKNSEARRAVAAQVLAYAAFLHGTNREILEADMLGKHLSAAGYKSITEAVSNSDQDGTLDSESFDQTLSESLATGRFRLVLVLDEAPADLVRLIGYLQTTTPLVIDLVTVTSYRVGDEVVMVPQRIQPVRDQRQEKTSANAANQGKSQVVDGSGEFAKAAARLEGEHKQKAEQVLGWARQLEAAELAKLSTTVGGKWVGLNVRIPGDTAIATVWIEKGDVYLQLWRTVLERRAPDEIAAIESAIRGKIAQGRSVRQLSPGLLEVLTSAYKQAAGSARQSSPATESAPQ